MLVPLRLAIVRGRIFFCKVQRFCDVQRWFGIRRRRVNRRIHTDLKARNIKQETHNGLHWA